MDQQSVLESKRIEVTKEILAFRDEIAPALVIKFFGRLLPRKIPDQSFIYWILIALILNLAMWGPGIIVSKLFSEPSWDNAILFSWFVGVQTCMTALITAHFALQNLLSELATRVINKINNNSNLDEFSKWIRSSWSLVNVAGITIIYCGLWVLLGVWGVSNIRGGFVGYGPAVTATIGGALLGIGANYIIWLIFLPGKLSRYSCDLNYVVPGRSEIINILSNMFNKHLYIASGYFSVATLTISFIKLTDVVLPIVILGWLLIILQFLSNRYAINKIIDTAKWTTLNNLQEQINHLVKTQDLSEKEPAEKLTRLTEIYERVAVSKSNMFDLKSISTFFSQLMLPLLGLLLGNLDKVSTLFP